MPSPPEDMSSLIWNVRGLGNPRAVQILKDLVLLKRPTLVFLMETKVSSDRVKEVQRTLGFSGFFVVNSIGNNGDIALL